MSGEPDLTSNNYYQVMGYWPYTTVCPYQHVCSDYGVRCGTCMHSPKRSYYQPQPWPYYDPWYPQPYNPWWEGTTAGAITTSSEGTTCMTDWEVTL